MSFICFKTVDFPLSPAPNRSRNDKDSVVSLETSDRTPVFPRLRPDDDDDDDGNDDDDDDDDDDNDDDDGPSLTEK